MTKDISLPETLGAAIDALYEAREEYTAASKAAETLKDRCTVLKNHVRNLLSTSDLEGGKGERATVSITRNMVPSVTNWDEVYQYIKENNAWSLLHKRLGSTAWKERLDAGELVPGTESLQVTDLSITKR